MARERIATGPNGSSNRWSVKTPETLSGTRTITAVELDTWQAFSFDPDGSGRTVVLPAEEGSVGAHVLIANLEDSSGDLTVKNDASTTVATVTLNECVLLWCDGTAWRPIVGANT